MHAQLQLLVGEFESARRRLRDLAAAIPDEAWLTRPSPEQWSPGECVAHLNLTTDGMRPLVTDAIERARRLDGAPPVRYRMDPLGWLLAYLMPPPVRFKVKTTAPFVPSGHESGTAIVQAFEQRQDEQIGWVRACDGLRISQVKVVSPFEARVKYNLFACLSILPRHQQRHLWQAEQAWNSVMLRAGSL